MPKATLMVRFRRPSDPRWIRRPAVYGSTGRVVPGKAEFKDRDTGRRWVEEIGHNYRFDVRVEDGTTTYEPAGKNAVDAEALRLRIMAKFAARAQCEAAGLLVIDPADEEKKRLRLKDTFDDYIEDAFKRGALEATANGHRNIQTGTLGQAGRVITDIDFRFDGTHYVEDGQAASEQP